MRAHFTRPVTDEQGDLLPNVQVSLFQPGTTTLIGQTVYSTDTGNNVLTNPYVSSTGVIDIYLDQPTRVRIGVVQGNLPMQFYEDVDVLAAGSDSAHTGTGPASLVIGGGASSVGDSSVALGASATSPGTNSVALGTATNSLGEYSVAIGSTASAQNIAGVASGRNASVTGDSGVAIGDGASASTENSVALGPGANAQFARSVAIGHLAETSSEDQIMLGAPGQIVEIPATSGLVFTSPGGTRYRLVIDDDGSVDTTAI